MSNRNVHAAAGLLAGGGVAAYLAREEDSVVRLLWVLGGSYGGYHGGILPDILEPAATPGHRGIAHSLLVGGGGAAAIVKKGEVPLQWARVRVRELEDELQVTSDPWQRALLALGIAVCHFAIGYGIGIAAGYASHLVLDSGTSSSLPLLDRT